MQIRKNVEEPLRPIFHLVIRNEWDPLAFEVARLGVAYGAHVSSSGESPVHGEPWVQGVQWCGQRRWPPALRSEDNAWVDCIRDAKGWETRVADRLAEPCPRPAKWVWAVAEPMPRAEIHRAQGHLRSVGIPCALLLPAVLGPGPRAAAAMPIEQVAMATLRAAMEDEILGVIEADRVDFLGNAMMIQ